MMRLSLALACFGWGCPLVAAPLPLEKEVQKPRARLLGSIKVDQCIVQMLWSPTGEYLLLRTEAKMLLVYSREQILKGQANPKPVATIELTGSEAIQLHAGTNTIYTVSTAENLGSESRFTCWDLNPILDGKPPAKPHRVVALELDSFDEASLNADGTRLLVKTIESKSTEVFDANQNRDVRTQYLPHLFEVSLKSGETGKELWNSDDSDFKLGNQNRQLIGQQLLVGYQSAEGFSLRAFDTGTGKQTWEKKLEGKPGFDQIYQALASDDGRVIAVKHTELLQRLLPPRPGARGPNQQQFRNFNMSHLLMLDGKTGESKKALEDADFESINLQALSQDGRLVLAYTTEQYQRSQLVAWETTTGKKVKAWKLLNDDQVHRKFNFSPQKPELAILELEAKPILGGIEFTPPTSQGHTAWQQNQKVLRTDYSALLSLWDFTSLVK